MALQEEGWPLGLRLLNGRTGMVENEGYLSASVLTASPSSSTDSSSDLQSQSTGSFFLDNTVTLGTLIGVSSILELSHRPTRRRTMVNPTKDNTKKKKKKKKKNQKMKPWLFSLCSKLTTDAVSVKDDNDDDDDGGAPSLSHYLEAERRAATSLRFNHCPNSSIYGSYGFLAFQGPHSLSSASLGGNEGEEPNRGVLEHNNGYCR